MTDEAPAPEVDAHIHALTAFMVVIDNEGATWAVMEPPPNVHVSVAPTTAHVRRACLELVADINAQAAAEYTAKAFAAQHATAAAQAAHNVVADALRSRGITPDRS